MNDTGKRVLIASSENAIRGLLMHLCDIPTDVIHEVEIPTGEYCHCTDMTTAFRT